MPVSIEFRSGVSGRILPVGIVNASDTDQVGLRRQIGVNGISACFLTNDVRQGFQGITRYSACYPLFILFNYTAIAQW